MTGKFHPADFLSEEDLGALPDVVEAKGSTVAGLAGEVCRQVRAEVERMNAWTPGWSPDASALRDAMACVDRLSDLPEPQQLAALNDLLGRLANVGAPDFAADIRAWVDAQVRS